MSELLGPGGVRWRLSLALMVSFFVAFLDRMNISLALPLIRAEQGWTEAQTRDYGALLVTLFYVGYGAANIFLSPIAARFGPRRSLLSVVVLWSLLTAMGALVSRSIPLLLASRVLLGLAEGVHVPMMNTLTKAWFPPSERSRGSGTWVSGLLLAVMLAPVILVPVMDRIGWRGGFLVLAGLGLLVTWPLLYWQVHDTPAKHPRITDGEQAHIAAGLAEERRLIGETAPGLRGVLRAMSSPRVALLFVIGTLNNVVGLGISAWLPTYFVTNKGLPYEDLVYATSLPYTFGVLGIFAWSLLGDRLGRRALLAAAGYVGSAISVYLALTAPGVPASIAFFSVGVFCISAFIGSEWPLCQRVFPREVIGPSVGLYNGVTTMVGGGVGPIVVSAIVGSAEGSAGVQAAVVTCVLAAGLLLVLDRGLRY